MFRGLCIRLVCGRVGGVALFTFVFGCCFVYFVLVVDLFVCCLGVAVLRDLVYLMFG